MRTLVCLSVLIAVSAGCTRSDPPARPSLITTGPAAAPEPALDIGPPDTSCAVFCLDTSADFYISYPMGQMRGLLVREFFRQALLIAARHELGMSTRDAWLGDEMPIEGAVRPFNLATRDGDPSRLDVLRGFSASTSPVGTVDLTVLTSPEHHRRLLWVEAEKLSRTGFVEVLQNALGRRQPHAWTADGVVPADVEQSLGEMTFFAQYRAARQIHAAIAADGESPALLGALVRAYANLGILTEFHWHPAHKVFKARAILYAQRWLARRADSLPALWHRAYALTLAGDHFEALDDLASAEKLWQSTAEDQRAARPAWLDLIDAVLHYDVDKLAAAADHAEHGQLATFLQYHTVELAGSQIWALETARKTLAKIPECYRVHDGACGFGGVSVRHLATQTPVEIFGQTLYARVRTMPGLPESVRGHTQRPMRDWVKDALFGPRPVSAEPEFEARPKLIAALRAASRLPAAASAPVEPAPAEAPDDVAPAATEDAAPDRAAPAVPDTGEPTWAALGSLIEELSFVHVWRRADFERRMLSVSADEFLAQAAPLVAEHRLRPFLETLAWDVVKQREAMTRCAQLSPDGLELQADPLLSSYCQFLDERANPIMAGMESHRDGLARDCVVLCRLFHLENLQRAGRDLLIASPHSPLGRAYTVEAGLASDVDIAAWDKLGVKYPAVATELARHYAKAERWDDALRCCEAAIKVVNDHSIYEFMAEVYEKKGDEDRALATLEAALQLPDYGLDHSSIQAKIAWNFMGKREWDRALPYATAAAQSYSGCGLLSAAACYEGLEQWDRAEQYVRATAERYRPSAVTWYYFCRRTGHGDLESARQVAQAYADDPSAHDARDARYDVAGFHILEGRFDPALKVFSEAFAEEPRPYLGLWVALLADGLHDAATRDAALARIRTDSPALVPDETDKIAPELLQLAAWIEADLAAGGTGALDLKAVDECRAKIDPYELAYFDMFLASYLAAHGKRDTAIGYWQERVASTDIQHFARTIAGAALGGLGIAAEDDQKPLVPPSQP